MRCSFYSSWSLRYNYRPGESQIRCVRLSLCSPLYLLQLQAFSHLLSPFQIPATLLTVKTLHSCPFSLRFYNPWLIRCLLPSSATLHPPINLLHSPLRLRGHATPPARAADQVSLNICVRMSRVLLCHFSKQLRLRMDLWRSSLFLFFRVVVLQRRR